MQRTVRQAGNSPYLSRSEQQLAQRWTLLSTSSIDGERSALTKVGGRERLITPERQLASARPLQGALASRLLHHLSLDEFVQNARNKRLIRHALGQRPLLQRAQIL